MKLYRWNTDIGEMLAHASDPSTARSQVMATLPADDAARADLELAIAGNPEVVTGPAAVVAWHK